MALTTQQILTCMALPDMGRDNARALISYAAQHDIAAVTSKELSDLIDHCFDIEVIDDIPEYDVHDFDMANRKADGILTACHRARIGITTYGSADYPTPMLSVKCGGRETAPALLFYKGDLAKASTLPGIAIIGTRKATPEGMKDGEFFGHYAASHGMNVVSGLALGCDSAAHRGALSARGFTTAILAFGLGVQSRDNAMLQRSVEVAGGLLLSEYAPMVETSWQRLVDRNRLQAGLSQSVLLIQSNIKKGGSMHAVNAAIEQGKTVYAIDYRNTSLADEHYTQCNAQLINQRKAIAVTRDNASIILPVAD